MKRGSWLQAWRLAGVVTVLALAIFTAPGWTRSVLATAVEVGFRDLSFPSGIGGNSHPTGEKPESKLWWNAGVWWGSLWSTAGNAYRIHRLDLATQTWIDTGTALDNRKTSRADTLWDGQHLYVASHVFAENAGQPAPPGSRGQLYRYSYDPAARIYTLDSGFPLEVTGGKSETLVLERDSTGTLWVTYVESKTVMVNHSLNGDDRVWGTPSPLPLVEAGGLTSDDISSLIRYNQYVGVMWSNQNLKKMYFAVHLSGAPDDVWTRAVAYSISADDHLNLKSLEADGAGNVFAVIKTSKADALIVLLVCKTNEDRCKSNSDWGAYTVYSGSTYSPTRPILLLDTGNRSLYVFSSNADLNGQRSIYYKTTPMDNIQFPTGIGTPFIKSATDNHINDPTSTKQNLDTTTGLVVLASDSSSRYYLHNYSSLMKNGPTRTPTATLTNGPSPTPTFTGVPANTPTFTPTATATEPGASSRIKDITFEDGRLIDPISGVDSVAGNAALGSLAPLKGLYSAVIPSAGSAYLVQDFASTDDLYLSFYLKLNSLPPSDARIALLVNSGTTVGNLLLRATGALRLRDGSTTIGLDSSPLTVGAVYRVGLHQRRGTGGNAVLEGYLAVSDDPFGTPFAATQAGSWTTAADRYRFGATTSTVLDVAFDDIRLDSTVMPGPSP